MADFVLDAEVPAADTEERVLGILPGLSICMDSTTNEGGIVDIRYLIRSPPSLCPTTEQREKPANADVMRNRMDHIHRRYRAHGAQ